jgi:hypothetical protein
MALLMAVVASTTIVALGVMKTRLVQGTPYIDTKTKHGKI